MYNALHYNQIIGVDEAGRGPLAGPVVAAAVILQDPIDGLTDSKKLSEKKREILFELIQTHAIAFAFGIASVDEIDNLNIHRATLLAMQRAIEKISVPAQLVLIDGLFAPMTTLPNQTLVQGDLLHQSISAASILAKVQRDHMMLEYAKHYPQFKFEKHKGYGTAIHLEAIRTHGPCPIHRKSFAPIKNMDF